MKSALKVILLLLIPLTGTAQLGDTICATWLNRKGVERLYGEWTAIRDESESAINRLKQLAKDSLKEEQLSYFITTYNSNVHELNSIMDDVKTKIRTDKLAAIYRGRKMTLYFRSRINPVLNNIRALNESMVSVVNAYSEKGISSSGGLWSRFPSIPIGFLEKALDLYLDELQLKMDCLYFKEWEHI